MLSVGNFRTLLKYIIINLSVMEERNSIYKMNKYVQDVMMNVKMENVEGSSIQEQIS